MVKGQADRFVSAMIERASEGRLAKKAAATRLGISGSRRSLRPIIRVDGTPSCGADSFSAQAELVTR